MNRGLRLSICALGIFLCAFQLGRLVQIHIEQRQIKALPLAASPVLGQATLAAAVQDAYVTELALSSIACVHVQDFLYIDNELMYVQGIRQDGVKVYRGQQGTRSTPHAAGSLVFLVPKFSHSCT